MRPDLMLKRALALSLLGLGVSASRSSAEASNTKVSLSKSISTPQITTSTISPTSLQSGNPTATITSFEIPPTPSSPSDIPSEACEGQGKSKGLPDWAKWLTGAASGFIAGSLGTLGIGARCRATANKDEEKAPDKDVRTTLEEQENDILNPVSAEKGADSYDPSLLNKLRQYSSKPYVGKKELRHLLIHPKNGNFLIQDHSYIVQAIPEELRKKYAVHKVMHLEVPINDFPIKTNATNGESDNADISLEISPHASSDANEEVYQHHKLYKFERSPDKKWHVLIPYGDPILEKIDHETRDKYSKIYIEHREIPRVDLYTDKEIYHLADYFTNRKGEKYETGDKIEKLIKTSRDNDVFMAEILHGLRAMGIFGINAAGFLSGWNPVGTILGGSGAAVALSHMFEKSFKNHFMDELKIEEMYPYSRRDYEGHFARQAYPYFPGMFAGTAIANQSAQIASHNGLPSLNKADKVWIRWGGGVAGYGVTGGLMAEQHFAQQGDRIPWLDVNKIKKTDTGEWAGDLEAKLQNLNSTKFQWGGSVAANTLASARYIPAGIATAFLSPRTLARWIPQLPYAGMQYLEQQVDKNLEILNDNLHSPSLSTTSLAQTHAEILDQSQRLDGYRSLADILETFGLGTGRNYCEYYLSEGAKKIGLTYTHDAAEKKVEWLEDKLIGLCCNTPKNMKPQDKGHDNDDARSADSIRTIHEICILPEASKPEFISVNTNISAYNYPTSQKRQNFIKENQKNKNDLIENITR